MMNDRPLQAFTRARCALCLLLLLLWTTNSARAGELARHPRVPAYLQSGQPVAFRDLGYGDQTARTMYGTLTYYFPVQPGLVPLAGSALSIRFAHSPLLVPDRSTMTVEVNGQSLASTFLTERNADGGTLAVALPVTGFQGDGFFVQVRFHMRLSSDECEEAQNPALWTIVSGDSTVDLRTEPGEGPLDLSDLARLFVPPAGPQAVPIAIVTPSDPSPAEMEAAGLVAFALGRFATQAGRTPVVEHANALPADRPAIVVATAARVPGLDAWDDVQSGSNGLTASGEAVPAENGLLALGKADVPRLLVTGATDPALLTAARALTDPGTLELLGGSTTIVTGKPAVAPIPPAWTEEAASFRQLGLDRQFVSGPGAHTLTFEFDRPARWQLRDGGRLELAIDASTALREDISWVSVTINGIDVGTKELPAPDHPGSIQRLTFELPHELLNADAAGRPVRQLDLQLRFFLDLPRVACTDEYPDAVWVALEPTSAWFLPHDDTDDLDLARFPAPLLQPGEDEAVSVVVPDSPNEVEWTAGLTATAALGRWSTYMRTVLPRLGTAATLTDDLRGAQHLLLIGAGDRNAVTAAVLEEDPDRFAVVEEAAYQPSDVAARSLFQLATSPWNSNRVVLVVSGSGPRGVADAAGVLADRALVTRMHGRTAVVLGARTVQASGDVAGEVPEAVAPRVISEEGSLTERLAAWQVVGAILLGALLAVVALVVVLRWVRRGGS